MIPMKKFFCALMVLSMICSFAMAEESVRLGFEDGFSLELPADWLHYNVDGTMADRGVLYCLSDAAAERWLYIQSWESGCESVDELLDLVNESAAPVNSGKYNFNGSEFVVYDMQEGDVSCCATLLNGDLINFVFTPQSDPDFMVIAAQVIGTFTLL